MVKTEKLVDLKGGLKHTASSAQIKSDGSLVIEYQKLDESQGDDLLLQLIGERFTDYYEVKQWIEENKIPHEKEFDPWA